MKVCFTIGDCNGIGLEVFIKAILLIDSQNDNFARHEFSVFGNLETIEKYFSFFQFPLRFECNGFWINDRFCNVINTYEFVEINFGTISEDAGKLALNSIEMAARKLLEREYDALVTLPISKFSLHKAGARFTGHTELLADFCKTDNPLMILCSKEKRVALATIHIPVKDVSKNISKNNLTHLLSAFSDSLIKDFNIKSPSIAVLGLNPHSGEYGEIGREEIEIIVPAIDEFKKLGYKLSGPFPADGFFAHGDYKLYDGILAMYHDQGLIPLKLLANGGGVNFTANLPIVRTSPDHGTAFDKAGKNCADATGLEESLKLAIRIAENRLNV